MRRKKQMLNIPFHATLTLEHKVILITGAGAGIGEQIALDCARRGAQVILLGRTVGKLERTYDLIATEEENIKQTTGIYYEPAIYPLDLAGANDIDYQECAKIIADQYQQLDGLVHNAAILGNLSPINMYAPQQWYKVIQTNLNAVFMLTQACLRLLEKSPNASIIFTSTGVAQKPDAFWGAYAVSKAASDSLMKIIAIENKESTSIRANSFSPGAVATRMRATAFPGEKPCSIPQTQDIAPYYAHLLSEHTQHLTGHIIRKEDFTGAPPIETCC